MDPGNNFKFSNRWFENFKKRFDISLRRKTHCSQKPPSELEMPIKQFHSYLLHVRRNGTYGDCDIANMEQTPLPYVLDDGKTYDMVGAMEVWSQSGQSGLDKRQATVQLTVFADGVARVRPTLIFRGTGKRIPVEEKKQYDIIVRVMYQKNAWCDEAVMKDWIQTEWANPFTNPIQPNSSGKILRPSGTTDRRR